MPFLHAAQQAVADPATPREIRLTLEYLLANAVGRNNAHPMDDVLGHLFANGIQIGPSKFQTTILAESREGQIFIGAGQRGYFLIETEEDARATLRFYESRIASELRRIANLRALSAIEGWNL